MAVAMEILVDLLLVSVVFAVASLTSSWALLRGFKPRGVVLFGALGAVLFTAGSLYVVQSGSGPDFFNQAQKEFDQTWDAQIPNLLKAGLTQDKLDTIKAFTQKYMLWAFPAWVAVGCLTAGLVAYYFSSALLRRIALKVEAPLAFREWTVPEPLVFGFLTGCILKLAVRENSPWEIVANNLIVFFIGLYTLGGLSIISFYLKKWRFSLLLRIASYIVLFQLSLQTIATASCLSILDIWFDFRKLKTAVPGEKAS